MQLGSTPTWAYQYPQALPAGSQKYGLAEDIEVDRQGLVHAFYGPGLGATIDFALIERKKLAVLA
jgi:hypothetical protein